MYIRYRCARNTVSAAWKTCGTPTPVLPTNETQGSKGTKGGPQWFFIFDSRFKGNGYMYKYHTILSLPPDFRQNMSHFGAYCRRWRVAQVSGAAHHLIQALLCSVWISVMIPCELFWLSNLSKLRITTFNPSPFFQTFFFRLIMK